MSEFIQMVTTLPSRDEAQRIANALVEQQLAACVQVAGPVTSVYRWEGKVETSEEWVCTAKTRATRFSQVAAAIGQLHPYSVPEVIATRLEFVAPDYAAWLDETLG